MRVKPAPGRAARLQDLRILPDEGANVPDNRYWRRRLARGDVVFCAAPKPAKGEKKEG